MPRPRLRRADWTRAALDAIAEGGTSAVAVESLAVRVGASKGSFYWHFTDRAALMEAAVIAWEEARTVAIISDLQAVADPRERLRKLFAAIFGSPAAARLELALAVEGYDPSLRPVVRRATSRRLAFISDAFSDLGFDTAGAPRLALTAYSTYVGVFAVREACRDAVPGRRGDLDAYLDDLLDVLLSQ